MIAEVEKTSRELVVGDVIVAKQGGKEYEVVKIVPGMGGPYLTLKAANGAKVEHDTSFDSYSATYTVRPAIPG